MNSASELLLKKNKGIVELLFKVSVSCIQWIQWSKLRSVIGHDQLDFQFDCTIFY